MADGLTAALQSKLVAYQSAGMTDHVERVQARLATLAKAVKADAKATENAVAKTPVAKAAAPKGSAVKKAPSKSTKRK